MTDFTYRDLVVRAILEERDREARAIALAAEARGGPRGFRAGFAARLARLALRLDGEAARFWLTRETGAPITNGSPS